MASDSFCSVARLHPPEWSAAVTWKTVGMVSATAASDRVVADANHPLAGMALHYVVRVRDVRPATQGEIERAAEDLDDAHEHVHGPDCDHAGDSLRIVS